VGAFPADGQHRRGGAASPTPVGYRFHRAGDNSLLNTRS
jgi:hypothetical protein